VKEGEAAEAKGEEVKETECVAGEVGSVVSLLRDNSWKFFFAPTM
jgi:hypothetical protein